MKNIVIKFGGAAMTDTNAARLLCDQLRLLQQSDYRVVLVHGGGPEIDLWLGRLGIEVKKVRGLRVTDSATMDVVEMVLAGRVNKGLVSTVKLCGGKAVGLSLRDGGIATCSIKKIEDVDLGQVGTVEQIDPALIEALLNSGFLPVICSVGETVEGLPLNLNADEAAAAIAVALHADLFVLLTDVPGILAEYPKLESLLTSLSADEAQKLITSGVVDRGMIPKVQSCIEVLRCGVGGAMILDGRNPSRIAAAIRREATLGTEIHP